MKKKELVKELAQKTGLKVSEAEKFLTAFTETVTEILVRGESINLIGFGKFKTVERSARKGRNPQTNEVIKIQGRTSPVFKAGKSLKEAIK